ncbi:facilitated trehalose transporter Tret1-2 homolog isoform X1 [Phlebotomus papatasi]|nr:facilitated trehalose transporter Tret1-2 homolog isoform X1 [Phlebotomus papatasi]XP_055706909.1 facilitated trehalose transporter Tret1-2 homolog isoform X1 [Phlebotomus papatasi]
MPEEKVQGKISEPLSKGEKIELFEEDELIFGNATKKKFSPVWRQVWAAAGCIFATISAGMTSGYSATLLPQLQANDSEIIITHDESTWIASMAALPMAAGCLMAGYMIELFGRRMSHLILCVPFVVGWVMIGMARTIVWILVGRFLTGLCVGLLGPVAAVFIGETSGPKYRGILLAAISLAIAVGILIAHIIGTFLNWKVTAIICGIFPLLCYIVVFFVPESPSWLLSKGQVSKATDAFFWLRGYDEESIAELKSLIKKYQMAENQKTTWRETLERIRQPTFWKPLAILLVFFFTLQFSGVNTVAFYSVTIMKDTLGDGINEYLAMIILDIVRTIMSVLACILLRIAGKRPLSIFSAFGTAISIFGLSGFLLLAPPNSSSLAWIPLVCLVSYICFVSIGLMPIPWCLTGEMFPLSVRGIGSGVSSAFNFLTFFVVVQTGPYMFRSFTTPITFAIYGAVAFFGGIFLIFFLPETRNKTLQDIEEIYMRRKDKTQP